MLNPLNPAFAPLALGMPMGAEWIVIAALGLLIFGRRLPEVGKGIGSAIRNFKKGLNEADTDADEAAEDVPTARRLGEETAGAGKQIEHKFDPYTGKPIEQPKPKFDPYTGKPVEEGATAS